MGLLTELYRIDEMARQREEAMWSVLDWAATQPGEFTIKDMHRVWVQNGGGGDNASYQQFSTAINNYIYKFDPQSPVAKYRNPRYKFIRVGKTDKGSVPAPLQFVTKGHRGAGASHVLRWRPGIAPMRQPSVQKAPLAPEGDPVGDALDKLEKKLGRPALKAAMGRWKQLGDLHKISNDIMADSSIRGKDKMLALQVAADSLVSKGKATQAQADDAEEEMEDEVGDDSTRTPFSGPTDFDDDEDQKTDPDAKPLGAQVGGGESEDDDIPDDFFHSKEPPAEDSDEVAPVEPEGNESEPEAPPEDSGDGQVDDGTMRATLVNDEGERIPATIQYDEDEGAQVTNESGEAVGPYDGYDLEVANGVLTQDAFDDLEEDGWNLVAAQEAQADDSESDADGSDDGGDEEEEPEDEPGSIEASSDRDEDVGDPEAGEDPAYVPEPDEEGDKASRAMFELVTSGHELEPPRCAEDDPIWGQLRKAKDSVDAHRVIKASGLPTSLHKYALAVARAIFSNTGRDFDSGKRNESRLLSIYGLSETLDEPVDFEQTTGLERLYRWSERSN